MRNWQLFDMLERGSHRHAGMQVPTNPVGME